MEDLIQLLLSIKSTREMRDFLLGLFSEKELDELSKRLKIVRMLKKNIPQQIIAKKLGVGIATVTRGSKEIQKGRFGSITWRNSSSPLSG